MVVGPEEISFRFNVASLSMIIRTASSGKLILCPDKKDGSNDLSFDEIVRRLRRP